MAKATNSRPAWHVGSGSASNFSRKKKLAFWHLLQGTVVRHAACLHATSEQEYQEIRAFGLSNPVAIIPNEIDLPAPSGPTVSNGGERTALWLGRIHPKKGLDHLVRAWAQLEAAHPDWHLRIIGPSELGHDQELRALAATPRLHRISIEEPVYGQAKLAIMRAAHVFVLPSLNETSQSRLLRPWRLEYPLSQRKESMEPARNRGLWLVD